MNRKTITTLLIFVALLIVVIYMQYRPEKGERQGERPRPMAKIDTDKIQKIMVTARGATVVLTRKDKDSWKLTQPVDYPADKQAVDSTIEKLRNLEFGDLVSELADKHGEYEVNDQKGVRVVLSDGAKNMADFYLGKEIDSFTMLRLNGNNQIFQAVGSLRPMFDREIKGWRNRNIINFKSEEARKLEITTKEGAISLTRPDEKTAWKVERSSSPIDRLDESTVSNVISSLSSLSAADFADDMKLDQAGLDQPSATLSVSLKAGEPITLLIGNHKNDDFWVQRKGASQVLVIKKFTAENLQKRPIDFRDKTIFSFKPEDVVSLTIDKKKDKETAKLTLKGTDWLIEGAPVKDASKVKSAIAAFASLKADGFASANAQELGLDKPGWTVEIQLKDRTRHQLSVGSVEKDGTLGVTRKGNPDIFSLRKYNVDRFLLEPKSLK